MNKIDSKLNKISEIRNSAELDKLNLNKPFSKIHFSVLEWEGKAGHVDKKSDSRLDGLVLVSKNLDTDLTFRVRIYQLFDAVLDISNYIPRSFYSKYTEDPKEFVYEESPAIVKIKHSVIFPRNVATREYIHRKHCNFSEEQLNRQIFLDYFGEGGFSLKKEGELVGIDRFPCTVKPHNTGTEWWTENFSPIRANGINIVLQEPTAEVLNKIESGRLSAKVVYRDVSEEEAFDIENHIDIMDVGFKFYQENKEEKCGAVLQVLFFPKYNYESSRKRMIVEFTDVNEIKYEKCEKNPF